VLVIEVEEEPENQEVNTEVEVAKEEEEVEKEEEEETEVEPEVNTEAEVAIEEVIEVEKEVEEEEEEVEVVLMVIDHVLLVHQDSMPTEIQLPTKTEEKEPNITEMRTRNTVVTTDKTEPAEEETEEESKVLESSMKDKDQTNNTRRRIPRLLKTQRVPPLSNKNLTQSERKPRKNSRKLSSEFPLMISSRRSQRLQLRKAEQPKVQRVSRSKKTKQKRSTPEPCKRTNIKT